MSRIRWEANLRELSRGAEDYARANAITVPSPLPREAASLSHSLYLAHSTAGESFSDICESGWLLSARELGKRKRKPNSAEVLPGTADFVFFYAAPFRFPRTACGLLFARSLEEQHRGDGVATPFDSGGLVSVFRRPGSTEPPRHFLSRHELPIPDHRLYLGLSLSTLFEKPTDYVEGVQPRWPGPIALEGGDQRRWTHEVRIPGRVFLRSAHLQAVFAPVSRIADPPIDRLFQWCTREGVDRITFTAPRGDDFEALRRKCLDYIRGKLLS